MDAQTDVSKDKTRKKVLERKGAFLGMQFIAPETRKTIVNLYQKKKPDPWEPLESKTISIILLSSSSCYFDTSQGRLGISDMSTIEFL